jgi:uncharacterized OsmC-like protein
MQKNENEIVHHVTLSLAHDFTFMASFDDVPGSETLVLDEPPPLGQGSAPNAAALLSAAVGNCLAASLLLCLKRTRAGVTEMAAHVTTQITRNETGRWRVNHIDVELSPGVGSEDTGRLTRCEELFEDFCIVTESVRAGIPVDVKVKERVAVS